MTVAILRGLTLLISMISARLLSMPLCVRPETWFECTEKYQLHLKYDRSELVRFLMCKINLGIVFVICSGPT